MENPDRIDRVPQILQWLKDAAQAFGLGPVLPTDGCEQLLREARCHTAAAGGEAAEAKVAQVDDCWLLADTADDRRRIDQPDQFPQVGVICRIIAHGGVLDRTDQSITAEPRRVSRIDIAIVLDVEQGGDTGSLDELSHTGSDAGARRDALLRQHHHRLEAMLSNHLGMVQQQAVGRSGGRHDNRLVAGCFGEQAQQRFILSQGQMIDVGVAAIEQQRHATGLDVPDDLLVGCRVDRAIGSAGQRRHGHDRAFQMGGGEGGGGVHGCDGL